MKTTYELVKIAYKKLKSSVYFDKTQLILRQKLVVWESNDANEKLQKLSLRLENMEFKNLFDEICGKISCRTYPKKLIENNGDDEIIFNFMESDVGVDEVQYFIDMDVEGHILGVLWLMLVGYATDEQIYEHSYGNRIRKKLRSEFSGEPTYSPYLFEPYFQQYESWRDRALNKALELIKANQDVVIVTMDLKRFYYSVNMDKKAKNMLHNELDPVIYNSKYEDSRKELCKKLTEFLFKVFESYSAVCPESGNKTILPIGFLPSNVLANWYLKFFDKAVSDGLNPIYYGRYVDDILIIDKAEKNSEIHNSAVSGELAKDTVIKFLLSQDSKWRGFDTSDPKGEGVLLPYNKNEEEKIYEINPRFLPCEKGGDILLQNDKVKIFYFKNDESDALLTCFRKQIAVNASEFRHMPEDDAFYDNDYSQIYNLSNEESPNKFRGITGFNLSKYELSKFIGKHLRVGGLIKDKSEHRFVSDIKRIFNNHTIIRFYDMWERIIEIFVINDEFDAAVDFAEKVCTAVKSIKFPGKTGKSASAKISEDIISEIRKTLNIHLCSSVCRAFALAWGRKANEAFSEITKKLEPIASATSKQLLHCRYLYLKTRMADKSVMPVFADMLLKNNFIKLEDDVNLTCFQDVLSLKISKKWRGNYVYYPYMISMYDISMISCIEQLFKEKNHFADTRGVIKGQAARFIYRNYVVNNPKIKNSVESRVIIPKSGKTETRTYLVSVGDGKKSRLKIAVANVKLSDENFKNLVNKSPNRSYLRYKGLSAVINSAINEGADMLIMPECCVPYEWLSPIARVCAKNNIAVVTGVEQLIINKKLFNLTAVILSFKNEDFDYNCSHISFHLKRHLSPLEYELSM